MIHPNVLNTLSAKRGGKGRTSPREARLARAARAVCNLVVPTGRGRPFPPYYHVDVALPAAKVAIEIDGPSHRTKWVRRADARKARLLRALGWSVLRVSNTDVEDRLPAVLRRVQRAVDARAQVVAR